MRPRSVLLLVAALCLGTVSACAPRVDVSAVGTGPINKPTEPAPVSPLPERNSFTGGPGVGASLNSGIGPGPSFNNYLAR